MMLPTLIAGSSPLLIHFLTVVRPTPRSAAISLVVSIFGHPFNKNAHPPTSAFGTESSYLFEQAPRLPQVFAGLSVKVLVVRRSAQVVIQVGIEEYIEEFLRHLGMDVFI